MVQNRSYFLDPLSSLISTSSRASVETYKSLKEGITRVEQSQIDPQELVDAAEKLIKEKFAPDLRSTFAYKEGSETISVKLDAVMSTMLAYAEDCGGERGKRYVASAIVACGEQQDVVGSLAALGMTWLTHFLFIFKSNRSHETQPDQEPHDLATPTLQETTLYVGEGVGHRKGAFQEDLMIRDGYKCVVTGFQDPSHPALDPNIPKFDLQGAHILRRAIAKFDNDRGSDSFNSAVTTFDILVNYTRLPLKTLEELHDHLDDPRDNVYALKIFRKRGLYRTPEFVTFKDRSGEFSSSRKRKRPISLPNPHNIAIHAAIAEVLHMSGAGKFFDELLDRYEDDEGNVPPVQSWPELENLMLEGLLKESLESMHLVTAH